MPWRVRGACSPGGNNRKKRRFRIVRAGRFQKFARCSVCDELALTHQQQTIAAQRLVHDVATYEQGHSPGSKLSKKLPQLRSQHWVEANVGFVKNNELGRSE